ncbi:MAG: peptidoglycan-binding protein [Proteobacteria bacterium]|nr:peptidoglycan-binding protein [Pseudomonadota bacterium]
MRRIVVALLLVILVPIALLFVAALFVPVENDPKRSGNRSNVAEVQRVPVAEVQRALQSAGLDPGPIDGVMGVKTRTAIRRFQEQNGLTPDGEVTPGLLTAIRETTSEGDRPTYSVIDSNEIPRVKLSLDVRLDRRASEQEIASIARELKDNAGGTYERTFIMFYLPGMTPGAGAWATAIFDPGLEVSVLGMTTDQERSLTSAPPTTGGDIIGVWIKDRFPASRITIFKKNGVPRIQQKYNDGSESTTRLLEQETSSGWRYDYAEGSATGDHFVITRSGTLEIRDNEGTISVARRVK